MRVQVMEEEETALFFAISHPAPSSINFASLATFGAEDSI